MQLDTAMDLQAVIVPFIETRAEEGPKLCEAAASGRVDQVEALLQLPQYPDRPDEEGTSYLFLGGPEKGPEVRELPR